MTDDQATGALAPADHGQNERPPTSDESQDRDPSSSGSEASPDSSSTSTPADSSPWSAPSSDASSAPPSGDPDDAIASAPGLKASTEPTSSRPPASSPPASDAMPPPSSAGASDSGSVHDSTPPASDSSPSEGPVSAGDCAEIPAYPHVVLTAEIKLLVELPLALDEATKLPHKLTLTSDDGTVSQTLALASDATAGDTDGTSLLTFTDLSEQHTSTLACDDGDTTYTLFDAEPYEQLGQQPGSDDFAGAEAPESP